MKKKIENRYEKNQNQLLQTNTSIRFESNSQKLIEQHPTLNYSQQTMEENIEQTSINELQTSFRRDLACSQIVERNYNPSLKKSKILLVEIDKNSSRMGKNTIFIPTNQAQQLAQIQRKTQQLVMKEKQQRKQLKKMKQLYLQKVEELKMQQSQKEEQRRKYTQQKSEIINNRQRVLQQNNELEAQLRQMQKIYAETQKQLMVTEHQKQQLRNRVQLLQANFDFGPKEPIKNNENLNDINRKIQIIQQSINRLKTDFIVDPCKLVQLFQTKCELIERRQAIAEQQSKKRQQMRVSLFNQIIISRNTALQRKNIQIQQLKIPKVNDEISQQKQLMNTTSSTFFTVKQCENQHQLQQEVNEGNQWDQIKIKTRFAIQSSVIKGHEQSYDAVSRVAMGMIQIFQDQYFDKEDISHLIDITLDQLNRDLVQKARAQSMKTSLLLKSMKTK